MNTNHSFNTTDLTTECHKLNDMINEMLLKLEDDTIYDVDCVTITMNGKSAHFSFTATVVESLVSLISNSLGNQQSTNNE